MILEFEGESLRFCTKVLEKMSSRRIDIGLPQRFWDMEVLTVVLRRSPEYYPTSLLSQYEYSIYMLREKRFHNRCGVRWDFVRSFIYLAMKASLLKTAMPELRVAFIGR